MSSSRLHHPILSRSHEQDTGTNESRKHRPVPRFQVWLPRVGRTGAGVTPGLSGFAATIFAATTFASAFTWGLRLALGSSVVVVAWFLGCAVSVLYDKPNFSLTPVEPTRRACLHRCLCGRCRCRRRLRRAPRRRLGPFRRGQVRAHWRQHAHDLRGGGKSNGM